MSTTNTNRDVHLYFRDIGVNELLTAEEERTLGWRIINDGDVEAKHALMAANLRLVIYMAKRHMRSDKPLADLIQDGNVALLRAVERFDPAYGVRFASYAGWWIRQAMLRAIGPSSCLIRIPLHVCEGISKCRAASHRLKSAEGREPTQDELSVVTGLTLRSIAIAQRARQFANSSQKTMPKPSDSWDGMLERITDESNGDPYQGIAHSEDLQRLRVQLDQLDERDARVLRMRFGLEGRSRSTLRQVAHELGLTHERVRQIEVQCLQRLQRHLCGPSCKAGFNELPRAIQDSRCRSAAAYTHGPHRLRARTGPSAPLPA